MHTMISRNRFHAILLGTLLAATTTIMGQTVSVADVTPDATDVTLRVLQFNMCNNICYGGSPDPGTSQPNAEIDTANSINSWGRDS